MNILAESVRMTEKESAQAAAFGSDNGDNVTATPKLHLHDTTINVRPASESATVFQK